MTSLSQDCEKYIDEDGLFAIHYSVNNYSLEFELYDIYWIAINGKTGEKNYPEYYDLEDCNKQNKDHSEFKPKFDGRVKWDGCLDMNRNEMDMVHYCGFDSMERELLQFKKIYELALEKIPGADKSLMGIRYE